MSRNTHEFLGKYTITGFPQRPAGKIIIKITFAVDEAGVFSLSAECSEEGDTNNPIPITVEKSEWI